MKKIIICIILLTFGNLKAEDEPFWEPLNMPEGGLVNEIICAPGDTLYIYHANGIFRSTDYAESWQQIRKGYIENAAVSSKNQIFASSHRGTDQFMPNNLIRSLDNGKTWDTVNTLWFWTDTTLEYPLFRRYIHDIKFDLNNKLYIIANNNIKSNDFFKGRFRILMSENLGETWSFLDTMLISPPESYVSIHPYRDSTYAIRRIIDHPTGTPDEEMICITHDNGKTYTCKNFRKADNDVFVKLQFLSENQIFVVYYFTVNYSSDGGKTWEEIQIPEINKWIYDFFAVNENNYYLIVGDGFIYTTQDKGLKWISINDEKFLYGIRNFSIDSKNNMYMSDIFGVKKSIDKGKTFQRKSKGYVNFLAQGITSAYDIVLDNSGNIYFGHNGIFVSRDNGNSWEHKELNEMPFKTFLPLNDGSVLSRGGGLYRSSDNGNTWELWYDKSISIVEMVKNKEEILFATTGLNSLYRSKDKGRTWEYLENARAGKTIGINSDGEISALHEVNGIYQSTDNGDTWYKTHEYGSLIDEQDPTALFSAMKFHPSKKIGFAGVKSFFKTTDNGKSWEFKKYYNERPRYPNYYEMAVDSLGNFWAGYNRSTDDGETWEEITSGIEANHRSVFAMGVSKNGYIFILTKYGGLYRSKQRYLSVENNSADIPSGLHIEVNPNPANSESEITYTTHTPGRAKLVLYNLLGIPVAMLTDTHREAGRHTARLTTAELAAGAYFLRLESGGEGVTKAVWVVR